MSEASDARGFARLTVPPMYTLVRVRHASHEHFQWTGHVYDVSAGGMRFELDHALEPGTPIVVRAMLPGATHTVFEAAGRVIRLHDADEVGPVRMGMVFETFADANDQTNLDGYLETAFSMRRAA